MIKSALTNQSPKKAQIFFRSAFSWSYHQILPGQIFMQVYRGEKV